MTHASHIALIEHELDGFHQNMVEHRQHIAAWYLTLLAGWIR